MQCSCQEAVREILMREEEAPPHGHVSPRALQIHWSSGLLKVFFIHTSLPSPKGQLQLRVFRMNNIFASYDHAREMQVEWKSLLGVGETAGLAIRLDTGSPPGGPPLAL